MREKDWNKERVEMITLYKKIYENLILYIDKL